MAHKIRPMSNKKFQCLLIAQMSHAAADAVF